jgi:hypothetical protein
MSYLETFTLESKFGAIGFIFTSHLYLPNFQPGEWSSLEKNKKDGFKVSISIWNQLRYCNFIITFSKLHPTCKIF